MNPIVCAVDGSPPSLKALEVSAGLAKKYGAPLHLAYVVVPYLPPGDVGAMALVDWLGPLQEAGTQILASASESVVKAGVAQPVTALLQGNAAAELGAYAEKVNAQFLVCGSRGYGALKRILLGSVAANLVRVSSCPVVVVP